MNITDRQKKLIAYTSGMAGATAITIGAIGLTGQLISGKRDSQFMWACAIALVAGSATFFTAINYMKLQNSIKDQA